MASSPHGHIAAHLALQDFLHRNAVMADQVRTVIPPVFVCYAKEDESAAKRIFNGLTDSGIHAWIDQDGLRGGDAWEQRIERMVNTCALFVPVISANTDARDEGFFALSGILH